MTDAEPSGFDELLLAEERSGFAYDAATVEAAGRLDYPKARAEVEKVLKFSNPSDYDALLLWAAQCRILPLLDLTWYLGFAGPKSAGKTTAARVARFLGHRVVEAGQLTPASLPVAMHQAHGLLLDEVDVLLRRSDGDLIAGFLRQGTDRDSPFVKLREVVVDKERTFELTIIPVFGPKLLTLKRSLDDALLSRCDLIRMPRARDPKIRRASTRFKKLLLPLKLWLDREAVRVLDAWDHARVETYLAGSEFAALSDALQADLDRTGQIGDLMHLVSHLYEWPTAGVIQTRLGGIEDAGLEDVTEEILAVVLRRIPPTSSAQNGPESPVRIKKASIKADVDAERKTRNEKPIWSNKLSEVLDDLGFKEERYSAEDRSRAVVVTRADVERLTRQAPPPEEVGKVGQQQQLSDGNPANPTFQSHHFEGTSRGGSWDGIPPAGPQPEAGPKGGPPSENPTIPPRPTLGEGEGVREEDLGIAPGGTKADRARRGTSP